MAQTAQRARPGRRRARRDEVVRVVAESRTRHKVVGGRYVRRDVGGAVAARVRLHATGGRGRAAAPRDGLHLCPLMAESEVRLLRNRRAAARDVLHLPQRAVGGGGPAGRGAPHAHTHTHTHTHTHAHTHTHTHTPHTAHPRAPGLALSMPRGSCRLDVESRGASLALAPPPRVCGEVYLTLP